MAQKPPQGPTAGRTTSEALTVRAEIDLSQFYNQFSNETVRLYNDLAQRGLTGEALADAIVAQLRDTFDGTFDTAGLEATHEAFSLGRNLEAQAHLDVIGRVVRTAILDTNTCDPCIALDGKVYVMNSPEYFRDMPPNWCDGKEKCRCMDLFLKEAA